MPSCPICKKVIQTHQQADHPCRACTQKLGLLDQALRGGNPVRFIAAGWYRGELRREILRLKLNQDLSVLKAITFALRQTLPVKALLVPIPSWKTQKRANPLPALICQSLGRTAKTLLKRCRPTVGQHHLSRRQRLVNMQSAFAIAQDQQSWCVSETPIWVVDDILTTGATAREAVNTLKSAGLEVRGLICLGRTP